MRRASSRRDIGQWRNADTLSAAAEVRGPRERDSGDCHANTATARYADASRRREAGVTMLKGPVELVIGKMMVE
jgi:hypothetical protein